MSLQRKRHEWIGVGDHGFVDRDAVVLRCARCPWMKLTSKRKVYFSNTAPIMSSIDWKLHNLTHDLVPGCK